MEQQLFSTEYVKKTRLIVESKASKGPSPIIFEYFIAISFCFPDGIAEVVLLRYNA